MFCPQCKNALSLDHITEHTDTETGTKTTNYFYTCTDPRCANYLKILNGCENGDTAKIGEVYHG